MENKLPRHPSKQKALDHALWLNFKHRVQGHTYGVIQSAKGDYLVVPTDHVSFQGEAFETLPENHADMDYSQIRQIGMDEDPLDHFEDIRGTFSVMDGELLRFILHAKIPLERFVRKELANRGYDKDHHWCGFDRADEVWLE